MTTTLLQVREGKRFTFLKHSLCLFWKHSGTVNLKKNSSNTTFRWLLEVNFTWSNSITLVEDLLKWKAGFETFLIDHYAIDTGNKILLVRNKKYLYQRHPPYTIRVSPHWMLLMETCLEVNIPMFYFYHLKIPSKIMKNVFHSFNSISLDSWKKIHPSTNIRNKCVRRDQVNLLVYGPDRLYFKQKRKNDVTKFWPTGFFLIYYFLPFEKKRNKT